MLSALCYLLHSINAHGEIVVQVPKRESGAVELDRIEVIGRRQNLIGESIAASEGVVGIEQIRTRPLLRTGDLAEFVPGLVATQHSGSGKANQYFLRGFNLDHSTDFATFVEDMPVNLRTHGHGQGYSDLNFLIPEMVSELRYHKGPYTADVGDFAAAGSAQFFLNDDLGAGAINATLGSFGYVRGVGTSTIAFDESTLLTIGVEGQGYDGPWDVVNEDVEKRNLALRFTTTLGEGSARFLLMAYDNTWNSADQIPDRAVRSNLISDFGSISPDSGGESSRTSVSGGYSVRLGGGVFDVSAYAIDYDLSLFSNFTYFLDNPDAGDQFRQFDDRRVYGGQLTQAWSDDAWKLRIGSQMRTDLIAQVGLERTENRNFVAPVRADRVREASVGFFIDGEYRFNESWRAYGGVRAERFSFDAQGISCDDITLPIPAAACAFNGGKRDANITTPKASLIYTVSSPLELYLSYGKGFHSNDARGTSTIIDPVSGDDVLPVTPLVDAIGSELGARVFFNDRLHSTLAVWQLNVESELLFVGDAGTTEASRPSARKGAELGVYWFINDIWNVELEASYTDSKFRDADIAGNQIAGSIPLVVSGGFHASFDDGYSAGLRLRHFGSYPLIENNEVKSDGATLVNMQFAKRWQALNVTLEVLNLFDSNDHDIDYFYTSRLQGELEAGVADLHYHVFEPRAFRISMGYQF